MKTSIKSLIAAALAGTALLAALPASADDGRWDRGDHREWRGDGGWGHHKHYWGPRYEERVVIRERPVYREYYYEQPVRYYAPPPVRYDPRSPAIVVGVDIPPLVFPLR